jgi:hypothetical protein
MKKSLLTVSVVLLVIGGCAAPPRNDGTSLLPPPGLSKEERIKNLEECNKQAYSGARSGVALTEQEKAPLKGRPTEKFYREGRPTISSEYTPNMWLTLIPPLGGYAPSEVSDRYVLCFLKRGYSWPNPPTAK